LTEERNEIPSDDEDAKNTMKMNGEVEEK